jgi:type IV pilus assembly protein PilY1
LRGRLWKFDLQGSDTSAWKLALTGKPLLEAKDAKGKEQPITSKPQAMLHPDGATMVYVGTGRFFVRSDNADMSIQTFYGIRDDNSQSKITRADLVAQTMAYILDGDAEYRVVSDNTVDYKTKDGFYIDLKSEGKDPNGERLISAPIVWEDRIIFNTLIPTGSACSGGVDGWLMEVEPFSGKRTEYSVFDLNNDGAFNQKDYKGAGQGQVVNGRKVGSGSGFTPVDFSKYGLNSGGNIQKIANSPLSSGRQSWQQIR